MLSHTLFHLCLSALLATAAPASKCNTSSLVVKTNSGVFAPYIAEPFSRVSSFLDIPYAESPVGDLRFAPPVAKTYPGDEVVKATTLPAGCFQYLPPFVRGTISEGLVTAAQLQRGDFANTTEDCLRLSIFAPTDSVSAVAAAKDPASADALPVIIWIHGGGYSFGGTNVPYQLAPNWVQRSQKHIVVQVQYRLNILGVPNAAGLAEEDKNVNLAFLDQRLAVEWVRDNIASFGGDPGRITFWGESAGAYAVDAYLYAWSDPIVSGVIADSGNAVALEGQIVDSNDHSIFSLAAGRLGCGNLAPVEELACMRRVPASDLQAYLQANVGEGGAADDGLAFGVVADNVTVFANYSGRIRAGSSDFPAQVPLLIGTNTDEGTAVVPYEFENSETATELPPDLAVIAQGFALNLHCTTLREVRLRSEAGATTYQYLYGGNFTNISPLPWLGAYHLAELPLIFGTHDVDQPSTEFEQRVSERMQDLYLAFATDPHAGLKTAGWPEAVADLESSEMLKWASDNRVEQVLHIEELLDQCIESGLMV